MVFPAFVFVVVIALGACEEELCTSSKSGGSVCNKSSNGHHNKYGKEINTKYAQYENAIKKAQEEYENCDETKCNCHAGVISADLKRFKAGISKSMIQNVKSKGTKYQIINNRLYREKSCMFPARCIGIEHFLLQLLPKLPDMDLIINTRDWPQIAKNYGPFGPVFSFSKTSDYYDIMYPAWAFWEGGPAISLYPRGIGRWDQHRNELGKKSNETKWVDKSNLAFFRGSRTSAERDPLVLLSREFPELIDAQYTKNQAWKSEADTLHAQPATEISFKDHCNYKFLFNFRGVAASFRFKHVLLCKSLVFHVGNDWQEFFYSSLKPWVHYVPVKSNASRDELKILIEFFLENENLAKKIAENGFKMVWNNLKMKDVTCYWSKLLKRYAKLLQYQVTRDQDLIEISN
ncbi:PREDICTED: O-glucosyltransferase rumi homolog [Nicrophorus vespilloides]|uniref:O-glucosyltransferase rumi homolog n=1 Tax=Nicrophorus vespilloides TaxID=110193 RepID=A0ABM1MRM7_NICVS|nr:PREDICTED: O-glucosyltransferase rumi homolog [Nicrophorus vespilloides]